MLDHLLDNAGSEDTHTVPIIARAIFWPGAWAHLHEVGASFLSGTCVLFRKATIISAATFPALFENFPEGLAPVGPVIKIGARRFILGLPTKCVDHITVKDWAFAEGLEDGRQDAEGRESSGEISEGAESTAAAV